MPKFCFACTFWLFFAVSLGCVPAPPLAEQQEPKPNANAPPRQKEWITDEEARSKGLVQNENGVWMFPDPDESDYDDAYVGDTESTEAQESVETE